MFTYQECTPPYQQDDPFSNITRRTPRQPLMRRNSYFSDAEDVAEAIHNINLSLDKG